MSFKLKKEKPSTTDKVLGCGCLIFVGLFCLAIVGGAMMGDYIGPPEGAARDRTEKTVRILGGLAGATICFVAGSQLVTRK